MNTKELSKKIGQKLDASPSFVKKVLDQLADEIRNECLTGGEVKISKIGTFQMVTQKSRTARNPMTNEKINVPEKQIIKFKPFKTFKTIAENYFK